jgi:hypothetical protein
VQVAAGPVPTTVVGCDVSAGLPSAGTPALHEPLGLPARVVAPPSDVSPEVPELEPVPLELDPEPPLGPLPDDPELDPPLELDVDPELDWPATLPLVRAALPSSSLFPLPVSTVPVPESS